jgi:hypothetical protein
MIGKRQETASFELMNLDLEAEAQRDRLRAAVYQHAWEDAVRLALNLVDFLDKKVSLEAILFPEKVVYAERRAAVTNAGTSTRDHPLNDCSGYAATPDDDSRLAWRALSQQYHKTHLIIATELWLFYKQLGSARPKPIEAFTGYLPRAVECSSVTRVRASESDPSAESVKGSARTKANTSCDTGDHILTTLTSRGTQEFAKLYEQAQCHSRIVARLYVLSVIAAARIESETQRQAEILQDLMEMLHGIQQPLLSLPLRALVSKMVLDAWETPADPLGMAPEDLMQSLLDNWRQSMEHWSRLSHYGLETMPVLSVNKLSQFSAWRQELARSLRGLVGSQLGALARIPALTMTQFRETILPVMLAQILRVSDALNQHYLLDCLIRAFPEEYLAFTLQQLLEAIEQSVVSGYRYCLLASLWRRLYRWMRRVPAWIQAIRDLPIVEASLEVLESMCATETDDHHQDRLDACEMLIELALQLAAMRHPCLDRLVCLFLHESRAAAATRVSFNQVPSTAKLILGHQLGTDPETAEAKPWIGKIMPAVEMQSICFAGADAQNSHACNLMEAGPAMPYGHNERYPASVHQRMRIVCRLIHASASWSELLAVRAFSDLLASLPMASQYQLARKLALWIILDEAYVKRDYQAADLFRPPSPERVLYSEKYVSILAWLRPLLFGTASRTSMVNMAVNDDTCERLGKSLKGEVYSVVQQPCLERDRKHPLEESLSDATLLSCLIGRLGRHNLKLLKQVQDWIMDAPAAGKREVLHVCAAMVLSSLAHPPRMPGLARGPLWEEFHALWTSLVQVDAPQATLLLIAAALVADASPVDAVALIGDLLTQALVLLEEDISPDSRLRRCLLLRFIDSTRLLHRLDEDRFTRLSAQVFRQAATLWVPADQCEIFCALASLHVQRMLVYVQNNDPEVALRCSRHALHCWERALATARLVAAVSERAHLLLDVYRAGTYMTIVMPPVPLVSAVRDAMLTQCRYCAAEVQQLIRRHGWHPPCRSLRFAWARLFRLCSQKSSLSSYS